MSFYSLFAGVLLASQAVAAPALTTIQDVLYKADGTRFNGTLTIAWSSFQAADNSTIVTQSTSVRVVDGNLRVQLVPSTTAIPAIYYTVTYNSDGRVQFQETWSVPSSGQPVRVRDVRVSSPAQSDADTGGGTGTGGTTTPLQESDIVGLIADLGARPLRGPAYAAGRVAMVNPNGALESVTGNPSDCVRVDGSTGPCGAEAVTFVDGDLPTGIVDGSNTQFSLTNLPSPASSLAVYRNGLLQKPGEDYTSNGRTIQFVAAAAPQPGDTLLASYRLWGSEAEAPVPFPASQVLCSGVGASTTSAGLASLGTCSIPAGVLAAGDRIAITFDFEHQGAASAFTVEIAWGATVIAHRNAGPSDSLVSGRIEAGLWSGGAQLSFQTWGTALPFAAGAAGAADAYAEGITIDFRGGLAQAGETLALRNLTVVRLP
jgi:hypothetical protein